MLRIAGNQEESHKENKAFKLKDMSTEEWAEINCQVHQHLQDNSTYLADCVVRSNTTRYLQKVVAGIRDAPGNHYQRRETKAAPFTPFDTFRKKHLRDPEYPLLIRSHIEDNDLLKRRIITSMVRRRWRSYLSKVRPSNVSALFS